MKYVQMNESNTGRWHGVTLLHLLSIPSVKRKAITLTFPLGNQPLPASNNMGKEHVQISQEHACAKSSSFCSPVNTISYKTVQQSLKSCGMSKVRTTVAHVSIRNTTLFLLECCLRKQGRHGEPMRWIILCLHRQWGQERWNTHSTTQKTPRFVRPVTWKPSERFLSTTWKLTTISV